MSLSQILRIPSGYMNDVNDPVVGQLTALLFSGGSETQGQLGKTIELDPDNVHYNSAIGNVYGGRFQYVQLSIDSDVPVIGQMLFWDNTVARSFFRVTTDPGLSSDSDAMMTAGICLSADLTPGNYTVIQIPGNSGQVIVKLRAVLTQAGAVGVPIYVSDDNGADAGLMDVLLTDATALVNARYIGKAVGLPVGGSTVLIDLVDVF